MFRKVSVVFGALALLAVASQGFVASEAVAKPGKYYVCHYSNSSAKSKVVQVNEGSLDTHLTNHLSDFETDEDGNPVRQVDIDAGRTCGS